jgi:2-oxoglutarate decarboxylase
MTEATVPGIFERLASDFGANYAFVLGVLEQYRGDRRSVDPSWRAYFDRLGGAVLAEPLPEREQRDATRAVPALSASRPGSVPRLVPRPVLEEASAAPSEEPASDPTSEAPAPLARRPAAPLHRPVSRALAAPALFPGDIAQPIRGGFLRLVENMELSLLVPTATSIREIPVRTLEENRQILNRNRDKQSGKVTIAHLVAWAIVRALEAFPRLNDAYAEVDGTPHRVHRDSVRLGIAIDVQRGNGERTLLVPNIKNAQGLTFAEFGKAFDSLVARARSGKLGPDDFMGTTVSFTNPGTVGTTTSAPRLMAGQGLIVASGAMDYPAEYRSMSARTLALLGISRVMTLTSTYDHRIIQGAESGLFLGRMESLLRGEDGFYERIF